MLIGTYQASGNNDIVFIILSTFNFEAGEATNLNLAHIMEVDCTDVEDLTRWNHSSSLLMLILIESLGYL